MGSNSTEIAMRAAAPGLLIGTTNLPKGVLGAVDYKDTTLIQLTSDLSYQAAVTGVSHVPQHEFEHILQNRVAARENRSWDAVVTEAGRQLGIDSSTLYDTIGQGAKSKVLQDRMKLLGVLTKTAPTKYLGEGAPKNDLLREVFADLSAIESYSGQQVSKDPVVMQELFGGNPKIQTLFNAVTGLRQERLDSKDLPPMTVTPQESKAVKGAPIPESTLDIILNSVTKLLSRK